MKTELEVARDAVRAALGDELADALEWAAAAVKHREQVLFAMTEHAGWSAGERCAYCASELVHDIDCTVATALHALDPEWNRREVELAHEAALTMARQRSDGPRLTTTDFIDAARYATQVLMRAAPLDTANAMLRAEMLRPPRALPLFDIYHATRVTMADGAQYEKRQQANGDWEWEAVPFERADATAREPAAPR